MEAARCAAMKEACALLDSALEEQELILGGELEQLLNLMDSPEKGADGSRQDLRKASNQLKNCVSI